MINRFQKLRQSLKLNKPLIHCITNPISINDCANAVLAVGAKPIMAEHPLEVKEITLCAKALAVNLGNITDVRMESIMLSGKVAQENNIPCSIDLVGVACSKLRKDFAQKFIKECSPSVIKGNMTELIAICDERCSQGGVDALDSDMTTDSNISANVSSLRKLSKSTGAVILASGKTDLVVSSEHSYAVSNGTPMLSQITGTGCMLNVLTASFISEGDILTGTLLATVYLGIAGELADTDEGCGTFRVRLHNALSTMSDKEFEEHIRIREV